MHVFTPIRPPLSLLLLFTAPDVILTPPWARLVAVVVEVVIINGEFDELRDVALAPPPPLL
jgi:hypothetical protein